MRGRRAQALRRALDELMSRGCAAAGYRLAGASLDRMCARHLYGSDRVITAWLADDHAVVVAIGPHDGSVLDVYRLVLEALGIDAPGDERAKPPCCDDAGSAPVDRASAESVADAIDNLARIRRRRGW
jgi:hypothetical protein